MIHYLIKIKDEQDGQDHYFIWSNNADAPITSSFTREEAPAMLEQDYRNAGAMPRPEIGVILSRVAENGIAYLYESGHTDQTLEGLLEWNRAGPNESSLRGQEIIKQYRGF